MSLALTSSVPGRSEKEPYTLIAIAALIWYLRGLPGVVWGQAGRPEQRLLLLSAVLTMAMIVTMGYIRENGRVPDLIAGHIQIQGQQDISQPQPTPASSP